MNSVIDELQSQIDQIATKISESQNLIGDPEMGQLALDEIQTLTVQKQALLDSISALQHQPSATSTPVHHFNQITLEVRPGTGGEEAKIWAEDLLRMYTRYCQLKSLKLDLIDPQTLKISGDKVYSRFKYESGVHRVQRVPSTESQGRIHTSTASVAVLPIVPATDIQIKDEDLDWQFYRSGGKGGQNVNKVNTAVRLTHVPTGEVVTCSTERSQSQNRAIALDMLRSRLWEKQEEDRLGSLDAQRRAAVGRAMRAEKIRTYNFPQNRVTDHRIHESWHNLDRILEGDLDKMFTDIQQKILLASHQNSDTNPAAHSSKPEHSRE